MTAFDPLRALRVLTDHGVRFVVIGGIAGATHGSPSVTQDLDVCPERSSDNLARLAEALRSIHARLRGADEDVAFILDARTLAAGDHFTFATDAGDVDCLGVPAGTLGYDDLAAAAIEVDLDGLTVKVAAIDDLIRMKRAAGRPRDLAELEILGALRDEAGGDRGRSSG
jgi:predicted nucleotidyltransferase